MGAVSSLPFADAGVTRHLAPAKTAAPAGACLTQTRTCPPASEPPAPESAHQICYRTRADARPHEPLAWDTEDVAVGLQGLACEAEGSVFQAEEQEEGQKSAEAEGAGCSGFSDFPWKLLVRLAEGISSRLTKYPSCRPPWKDCHVLEAVRSGLIIEIRP